MAECFREKTATFMILGDTCTRNCLYCGVRHGAPACPDEGEPERVAQAASELGLRYIVVTSVTRDDLPDGGARQFAETVAALRRRIPGCRVEVLIPDFQGNGEALQSVIDSRPDVINHNIEVVEALYGKIRPQGSFQISLDLLNKVQAAGISKSGFMVGFGEGPEDIEGLLGRLSAAGCRIVTIGQYQQPAKSCLPVVKYYSPDEFRTIKTVALSMGFHAVEAGPLVRSSYRASQTIKIK